MHKKFIYKLDCIILQHINIIFSRPSFNVSYVMHFCVNILALLHAGVGEAIIATIFALLNSPCITPKTCMKKAEHRAGCAIESLAKESCDVTLIDEIEKSRYMTSQFSYISHCKYDCLSLAITET